MLKYFGDLILGLALFILFTALSLAIIEINITFIENIPGALRILFGVGLFFYGVGKLLKPFIRALGGLDD